MKTSHEKDINSVVDFNKYPLSDSSFINSCRMNINRDGSIVLPGFLTESGVTLLMKVSKIRNMLITAGKSTVFISCHMIKIFHLIIPGIVLWCPQKDV
mgnify:CR=1 FL=1